jgi:threonine dehydrogenase-like Zn-dependent dehydrogenase
LLTPDQVLVAVEAAVVATPELRAMERGGRVPGGAAVGRVIETGEAARDELGRRVLVGPLDACGECDACRRGRLAACPALVRLGVDRDGALASRVISRRRWTCALAGPLEGAVPGPAAAALAREAPLAYALLARAGVAPGEITIWIGDGAIARYGAALARSRGAHAITASADDADDTIAARAAEATTAQPACTWRIFETTGTAAGRARAVSLASSGGMICAIAGEHATDRSSLAATAALDRDAVIAGVSDAHPDLVPEVAALAAKGDFDPADGIWTRPIAELDSLVADLRSGRAGSRLAIVVFPS